MVSGRASNVVADSATKAVTSDEELVGRLAAGPDEAALSELYDRYQAMMYGLAMRITNDAALAQDAVQEAFVGVWRNASRYAVGKASVRTWMLSITHHRAIDILRRRRATQPLPEIEEINEALTAPDVWGEVARAADAAAVRTALDGLPEAQRSAIQLAYFSGLTQTEIAARENVPLGTVKSRVRLGLASLRRVLEEPDMTPATLSHDEAMELAGLYALDALTPDEKAAVDAHVAACAEDHSEIASLGGVTPALASLAEPVGAPAALKRRVLEAYAADVPGLVRDAPLGMTAVDDAPSPSAPATPAEPPARRRQAPNWMGWAAAAIAIVLLAVLSAYGLNLRQQADQANQRAEQIAAAVAAMTAPGSQVAILHGTGTAAGVNGFAAFPASGGGYVVMTDVPHAPNGMTYQAWYIVDKQATSAGVMTVGPDGNVVASGMEPLPGTQAVAFTLEPDGGSDQPTSQPIIVGNVTTPT